MNSVGNSSIGNGQSGVPVIEKVKAFDRRQKEVQTILSIVFPIFVHYYPDSIAAASRGGDAALAAEIILAVPGLGMKDPEHPHLLITGVTETEKAKLDEKKHRLNVEIAKAKPPAPMASVGGGGNPPPPFPPKDLFKNESIFSEMKRSVELQKYQLAEKLGDRFDYSKDSDLKSNLEVLPSEIMTIDFTIKLNISFKQLEVLKDRRK